ncbi:MAG: NAD(P)-dependent oxidoreductase [Ruthenibacterium sp.]
MSDKVLIVSFSFEQEPEAFEVLRTAGYDPLLWALEQRGEVCTEEDLICYWNKLPVAPRGIVMGADVPLTERFLSSVKTKPEAVALNCAGYDHLDLEAFARYGVKVCNVPRQNFSAVADLAFGLILNLMRKISQGDRNIRAGNWAKGVERGIAVSQKTIGILGFGAVGQTTAKRAMGFEMKILAYDVRENAEVAKQYGATYVTLEELFMQSDIFVVCAAATEQTYHLVNANTLKKMKPSAVLINASRGTIVDTQALLEALKEGTIAGAGLDVYEEEPLLHSELFAMENTVLTPHMGGLADREIHNVAMQAARNMVCFLQDASCELKIV